jgi:hypothetical protein
LASVEKRTAAPSVVLYYANAAPKVAFFLFVREKIGKNGVFLKKNSNLGSFRAFGLIFSTASANQTSKKTSDGEGRASFWQAVRRKRRSF